jgi:hypothetical protein
MFASRVTTLSVLDANKFREIIRKPADSILTGFAIIGFQHVSCQWQLDQKRYIQLASTEEVASTFFLHGIRPHAAQGCRLAHCSESAAIRGTPAVKSTSPSLLPLIRVAPPGPRGRARRQLANLLA